MLELETNKTIYTTSCNKKRDPPPGHLIGSVNTANFAWCNTDIQYFNTLNHSLNFKEIVTYQIGHCYELREYSLFIKYLCYNYTSIIIIKLFFSQLLGIITQTSSLHLYYLEKNLLVDYMVGNIYEILNKINIQVSCFFIFP